MSLNIEVDQIYLTSEQFPITRNLTPIPECIFIQLTTSLQVKYFD